MSRSFKVGEIPAKRSTPSSLPKTEAISASDICCRPTEWSFPPLVDRPAAGLTFAEAKAISMAVLHELWMKGRLPFWNAPAPVWICRTTDWSGKCGGLSNGDSGGFAHQNRAVTPRESGVGDLRITDGLFRVDEQERNQVEAGRE